MLFTASEITERLTQIPRARLRFTSNIVWFASVSRAEGMFFDEESHRMLRRIEQLRTSYGVNLRELR